MSPVAMTVVLLVSLGVFAWSAVRRWNLLTIGNPEPRAVPTADTLAERIKDTVVYAFLQKKLPYYPVAGIAHVAIFFGFLILLLRSIVLWSRGYDPSFDFWGILALDNPIGALYNIVKDVFNVLVVLGALVFVYYRVVVKEKRMTLSGEGLLILFIIITMMLGDLLYDGAFILKERAAAGEPLHFSLVEPAGSVVAMMITPLGLDNAGLTVLEHVGFWWHSVFVLIFLNILPFSKHFHIITVMPNIFLRRQTPPGKLVTIEDLEGKVEREEPIGRVKITDVTWKDILDYYTCTECGRCSDNCPAYNTGKKLSPKHLILAQRDHLYACEKYFLESEIANPKTGDGAEAAEPAGGEEKTVDKHEMHHADPPEGAYFTASEPVPIVPEIVIPEVIWSCTTCRACEEFCPVLISHVEGIIQLRRNKVMIDNEFPAELMKPFDGVETNSNPWNLSAMDRGEWAGGIDAPLISDNKDADVLFYVGCAGSFDDRAKKTSKAMVKLMNKAGVNFAILGAEEPCCGDPARRGGNEYLFQTVAEANVELFKSHGIDKKKIVTACPHCFNTIKHEYPDFGGNFDVVHHAEFLLDLIQQGKLKPEKSVEGKVVYHDSCYLGRHNQIYDAPRQLLQSVPGVELVEPEYWKRNKAMCCGAGGAQMFMEEHGERINYKRTKQLLETGAGTIATGCPFCMTMLTDGLKAEDKEEEIQQLDLMEILERSIDTEK
jgi:Fe-S oxidoreductase